MVERSYLLDTNVIAEPLKPCPIAALLRALQAHAGALVTAAPVWHELTYGCDLLPASRRKTVIDRYLREVVAATLPVLPYDHAAARWHAAERARIEKRGKPPSFVGGQIAAIAAVNGAVLVTRDLTGYQGFSDLLLEDWFAV